MFGRYKAVFRKPGTAAFCASAFIMRMPIAIYPIGIVLIISAHEGRYGFAGVLSGCYIIGNGIGNPLLGRLADRRGQRRVILPATALHAVAVITLALLLRGDASHWLLVIPAVVFGISYPPVISLVRARWAYVVDGSQLTTALSLESVLDEVIFVVGPLIATVLATQATPDLVLYVSLALVVGGALWLAALRASDPPPPPHTDIAHVPALRVPGMPVLTLASIGMGATFATAEVSMVAYCGQHGQRGLSGLVLACIAFGSGLAGLVYGAVEWRADLLRRFRIQALAFAALPCALLATTSVTALAIFAFVLGLGIAPALITAFGLVQQIVPPRALTEGLSWISTGLNLGYGAGAALVGGIADRHGARTAFLTVIAASVLVGSLGLLIRTPERELVAS